MQLSVEGKTRVRRSFVMLKSSKSLLLAMLAFFFVSCAAFAQTAAEAAPANSQVATSTPDLSGIWMRLRDKGATARGYPGIILDLGQPTELPMTPWAAAIYKVNSARYHGDDPDTVLSDPVFSCYPPGVPRIYLFGFPMQIVQAPGQVIMLFEYDHFVRRIYTDGRPHDMNQGPLWMGDSIGKWEGDTLVADTVSFNDKSLIDRVGHPHSDALHVVERIRRLDPNSLEIGITVEDPKAYTQPWSTKLIFESKADWKIMEQICEDNASFIDFNDKSTAKPATAAKKPATKNPAK
jgi:hypothetical protein